MLLNRPAFAARPVLTGTLALLASSIAMANQDGVRLSDTVVTASGFEQKITEAPASISVISQQDLQQNRFSNLAQALDGVEGIDIRQSTGKTGGLNISIRGMPSEYTLILIDGRRQNAAGNVTPNGFNETATSFMPPLSAIERIEVIRGPMSTLYGSDAMGGVVNIITKKVSSEWGGSVTLDHTFQEDSDWGETSTASLYTSGPLIDGLLGLTLRGNVHKRDESNLNFDDGSTVNKRGVSPVEGRNTSFGARLTLTPTEDHDLALDVERGRQKYNNDDCQLGTLDGRAGGSAVDGCSTSRPTQANGYRDQLRFEREQLAVTHTGRFGFGTLDSSLMHNTTESFGRTVPGGDVTGAGDPIGTAYDGYPSIIVGDDRKLKTTNMVFDTKLSAPVGESHFATVGAQWWKAKMTDGLAGEDFKQTTKAVFAEDEWRLTDALALTLGARYDDHETFGGHFSPRAYLVWNTTDEWTLKGGVSRGYKAPDVNDLHDGINGITGQGTVITVGNPDLQPEKSTNYEVGAYFDSLTGFNANATLFHNKFKDKITTGDPVAIPVCAGNPASKSTPAGYCPQKVNVDEAETQGVELASRWQFAPGWALSGNYTYTESEQRSGAEKGAPLTNTPRHMAFAKLNWDATDRTTVWFKGEYRGKRARFLQRSENLKGDSLAIYNKAGDLKAYEVFHLGGSFQATDNISVSATIYNVFDKDFSKGTTFTNSDGDPDWVSTYVQSGRSTDGTLEEGRRLWLSTTMTF